MSTTRSTAPTARATDTPDPRWADSALLVVGHGGVRKRAEETAAFAQAARIESRGLFAEVRACFLKGRPEFAETAAAVSCAAAYVVPFLMADGLAARDSLGAALARAEARRGKARPRWLRCEPVGVHPGLARAIARRIDAVCEEQGLASGAVSVLLAAHGTPLDPASRLGTQAHVARLAASGRFARVRPAFLEEPPFLGEVLAEPRGGPVIVAGLFAESGLHGEADVARLLAQSDAGGPPALYAGPIGSDPALADLILDQVRACAAGPDGR